jgi:hypothetical protein
MLVLNLDYDDLFYGSMHSVFIQDFIYDVGIVDASK